MSHSCDILHKEEDEPYIDLLIGRKNKKNNIFLQGRNPRRLQIEHTKEAIEFLVHNILHVEKKKFEAVNPKKSSIILNKNDIKLIIKWVAKRYTRAAFPDEFSKRLPRKQIEELQKNDLMKIVTLIFIDINDTELKQDQDYEIIIFVGVQHNIINKEIKSQLEELFYKTFNITGITADLHIHDEYDINYNIINTCKRFDWDFRSLPENVGIAIPNGGIDTN